MALVCKTSYVQGRESFDNYVLTKILFIFFMNQVYDIFLFIIRKKM